MYLLYSRKSTNVYSLVFSILNIISSSLWINYSMMTGDTPLLVRDTADLILFTISSGYIIINRIHMPQEDSMVSRTVTIMVQPSRTE